MMRMKLERNLSDAHLNGEVAQGEATDDEHAELMALLETYQIGVVRKSQGIREAVERGLMKRLDE
jgi:hypothetical protein